MVRAAAKNHRHVAVVVNPARYPALLQELAENGTVSAETRFSLAVEAFNHTAHYDALIAQWLASTDRKSPPVPRDPGSPLRKGRRITLRRKPPTTGGLLPGTASGAGDRRRWKTVTWESIIL